MVRKTINQWMKGEVTYTHLMNKYIVNCRGCTNYASGWKSHNTG